MAAGQDGMGRQRGREPKASGSGNSFQVMLDWLRTKGTASEAAKVMSSSQVEEPKAAEAELRGK